MDEREDSAGVPRCTAQCSEGARQKEVSCAGPRALAPSSWQEVVKSLLQVLGKQRVHQMTEGLNVGGGGVAD